MPHSLCTPNFQRSPVGAQGRRPWVRLCSRYGSTDRWLCKHNVSCRTGVEPDDPVANWTKQPYRDTPLWLHWRAARKHPRLALLKTQMKISCGDSDVRCKESLAQRSRSSREQDEHPNPLQNDTSTTVPYEYTIASYYMIANIHFCCFILFFCEKVAELENTTKKRF
jgi:hypothetical protein